MPSTLSLVAAGLGVSLTPASMRRLNVEGVTLVPLTRAHGLTAPLMLATRRQRSAATERFREAMCSAARLEG
jgi:DNA-binding transcriptional LysR family regulator